VAVASNALTTLATVLDELKLTSDGAAQDARAERYIDAASAFLARECDRIFERADAISEKKAGYGYNEIILSRRPVVAVTSVTVNGAALSSSDYELRDIASGIPGVLYRAGGWSWSAESLRAISSPALPGSEDREITVVYNGGWVTPQQNADGLFSGAARTLPADIEDACVLLVASRWRGRGTDYRARSRTYEGQQLTFGGVPVPHEVEGVIAQYRMIAQGS